MLTQSDPASAERLLKLAQEYVQDRWQRYEYLSNMTPAAAAVPAP